MLKDEHHEKILKSRQVNKDTVNITEGDEKRTYQITGILYSDPDNWTVWVNEQPFSSSNAMLEPGVTVMAKDHRSVEICVGSNTYVMFPGQTFVPKFDKP